MFEELPPQEVRGIEGRVMIFAVRCRGARSERGRSHPKHFVRIRQRFSRLRGRFGVRRVFAPLSVVCLAPLFNSG